MEREEGEDVATGGGVTLNGRLVGAVQVQVLKEDTGHCRETKVVGVDVEEPLVPVLAKKG